MVTTRHNPLNNTSSYFFHFCLYVACNCECLISSTPGTISMPVLLASNMTQIDQDKTLRICHLSTIIHLRLTSNYFVKYNRGPIVFTLG